MRFFVAAISLAVLMTQFAWAGGTGVDGQWVGQMRQIDPDREERYSMTLTLDGAAGTTNYPSLNCGGVVTKVSEVAGGYTVYKETITRGALTSGEARGCVDGVLIVSVDNGTLTLGWFAAFGGEPMLASAVLTKASS